MQNEPVRKVPEVGLVPIESQPRHQIRIQASDVIRQPIPQRPAAAWDPFLDDLLCESLQRHVRIARRLLIEVTDEPHARRETLRETRPSPFREKNRQRR